MQKLAVDADLGAALDVPGPGNVAGPRSSPVELPPEGA